MKKITAALLLAAILLLGAAGCGTGGHSGGLRIVTTIFPIYDWTRNILGEEAKQAELTLLMDSGVDIHSYQATAEDIARISECDVFIYVGGTSDTWVDDALAQSRSKNRVVIDLMEILGSTVRLEELTEGMESDGDETEYDEHIWLSFENAKILTAYIAAVLEEKDPDNAEAYAANAAAYLGELAYLEGSYYSAIRAAEADTLVFGDRFPFRYMTDEFGLSCYAAFPGCSAETEASFETILFLAEKVDELGLPAVMTIEGSDHRVAETVAENCASDPAVLTLDSMQSVTDMDASYLTIMEENLAVLRQALSAD